MATPRYLSGSNGFIPVATGQAIAYVRDPARFKLNQYAQLIRAPKPVVAYAFLDPDQPVRVENDDMFAWEDGNPRPLPANNTGNFLWNEVRVFRRDYGFVVGEQALEAAEGWNPKMFFSAQILSQAMTNRTNRFVALMTTVANWGANTSDANTLNKGAGTWDKASNDPNSPFFLAIKKSLQQAVKQIVLATNAAVLPSELMLVIGPDLALTASETSEVHSYVEKSVHAYPVLEGQKLELNLYGLPPFLYGLKVIVEDAPLVTSNQTSAGTRATTGRTFCMPPNQAFIVSRVGGLEGNYGSPSYSTIQRYYYKYDLAVEAFDDPLNKRVQVHVVDQFKEVLPAPQSGEQITNCV